MKTTEFIKAVEELGFITASTTKLIRVKDQEGIGLVLVRKDKWLELDTLWNPGVNEQLFDLAVEYAKTPIEEREEPKKYYLRHKYLKAAVGSNYLVLNTLFDAMILGGKTETDVNKTKFTRQEIEYFPKKFSMSDWELIEVPE